MTAPVENTLNAIVWDALVESGRLASGDTPDSEILARYSRRVRGMINVWQTQGLKLFLQTDFTVTLIAGQTTYVAKPGGDINITKPLRVQQGYYLDSTSPTNPIRRPLYPLSWNEWLNLSTTITQGPISQYFVDKQATQLNISFWLTPDSITAANGTAHLMLQQQVVNPVNLTDTMQFPLEWTLPLMWGLADEMTTGQPQEVVMRCTQKAMSYKTALENWDVEDASTSFQPDSRQGNMGQSQFT